MWITIVLVRPVLVLVRPVLVLVRPVLVLVRFPKNYNFDSKLSASTKGYKPALAYARVLVVPKGFKVLKNTQAVPTPKIGGFFWKSGYALVCFFASLFSQKSEKRKRPETGTGF